VHISVAPVGCEEAWRTLMTRDAVKFVAQLVIAFDEEVEELHRRRQLRKLHLDRTGDLPDFLDHAHPAKTSDWKVAPVPERLNCRHLDLGDVSPSNTQHFEAALRSSAQGIQTDFDDGHCPSWPNQLRGLHNVFRAVHHQIPGISPIQDLPILMLRPRAWNMTEFNMMVNGKAVPGPLFDFGMLMYHNAKKLLSHQSGPFFYLSKASHANTSLEGFLEARVWNSIFKWAQNKLGLPLGSVKACVLIENVLASFEMEEILYELKEHSVGLNCGIWDYSASFVNKFGHRSEFVLPDRSKYVSMEKHFLSSYMDLVVQTCHRRGAHATGGMAAALLPPAKGGQEARDNVLQKAALGKLREIKAGVDGFMVYDIGMLSTMQEMFKRFTHSPNQLHVTRDDARITAADLLVMPSGGVTLTGLRHNVSVGIMFIFSWFKGRGHYFLNGAVEDSATAEISRSQVWQWIRHCRPLEDDKRTVTSSFVQSLSENFVKQKSQELSAEDRKTLETSAAIFLQIVTKRNFPEFITTYLSEEILNIF
ncbi:hypothetical protein CAPTEDRAFT_90017, partial [Capitella teleta]